MAVAGPMAPFRHEAVLYAGDEGFVDRIGQFVHEGISAGEPNSCHDQRAQDRRAA